MEKDPFKLSPEEVGWGEVADKYIHTENQRLHKEREEQVKVAQEATKSATLTLSRWIKFVGGFVVCSVVVGLVSPSLPRVVNQRRSGLLLQLQLILRKWQKILVLLLQLLYRSR